MPPYLWLRFLTEQRLVALHRHHLKAKMREAGQEICLHQGGPPPGILGLSLAALLLGRPHLADPGCGGPRCRSGSKKPLTAWSRSTARS